MTDAPRTIWARAQEWPKGSGRIEVYASSCQDPDEPAPRYHHDAVVRELVKELQAALSYFDHHGITGGSVETTRAALAKIAQEGKP